MDLDAVLRATRTWPWSMKLAHTNVVGSATRSDGRLDALLDAGIDVITTVTSNTWSQ